ncbi:hypothetical protein [Synechococcus phage S-B28]|uniref:Uncharacterized protein n=1 Tax=Synechococcus phage S-B28 TaxID=2545435 RepID=A0A482IEY4_9CAUD|nr:hypothetical protein HOV28_gp09 [Synechococcus phage S-B28]QBP05804.1 hypothetical protein [Synechococcus phage S-B28]
MLVQDIAGLYIPQHDYVSLTYVASGNGVGEIETITYKQGGASGATVAVMTLVYDANNKLVTVTKV